MMKDWPHCVVQDCVPFGAAAQKGKKKEENNRIILQGFLRGLNFILLDFLWNWGCHEYIVKLEDFNNIVKVEQQAATGR